MRAFVKYGSGPGEAEVRAVPDPEPGSGQVLVDVAACGICGSDLHAYRADPGYEWIETPVVLGHEFSGKVAGLGPDVAGVRIGDRVVAMSIQHCGGCEACVGGDQQLCTRRRVIGVQYDGGLAERVVVPERYLVAVPDDLDLVTAALAEPLSVAVHAVTDRASVGVGDRVVVTGPGAVGLMCGRLALLAGADVLILGTDRDATRRLPAADRLGLRTGLVEDEALRRRIHELPPDVWIEASGAPEALMFAIEGVRRGGVITVVAVYGRPVTWSPTEGVRKELSLLFSYASRREHYGRALSLLGRDGVDPSVFAERFPLEEAEKVFVAAQASRVVKPLMIP